MDISDSCTKPPGGSTTRGVQANRACAADNCPFRRLAIDGEDVAYDRSHEEVSWLNGRREAGNRGKFGWFRDVALVLNIIIDIDREDHGRRLPKNGTASHYAKQSCHS